MTELEFKTIHNFTDDDLTRIKKACIVYKGTVVNVVSQDKSIFKQRTNYEKNTMQLQQLRVAG